jgi:hypothetical protein
MVHKREHEKKMRMKKQGARRVTCCGWEIVVVVLCTNLTTEEVAAVGVMEYDT